MNRTIRLLLPALAVLAFAFGAAGASAAPIRSEGAAARALADAEALFGPSAATGGGAGGRDASTVLRRLAVALPRLSGEDRRRARRILARPTQKTDPFGDYFGVEAAASPICDSHFCIHWSRSSRHAPAAADSQPNGIPDFVEQVLAAAAHSYDVENVALGWRDARSDGTRGARDGRGASGQVDIYLADLGRSLFGYATPDAGEHGRRRAGYLVIDNDYAGFSGDPGQLMRVTIAHEYNHILQFNYDTMQDSWMFESTATWVEDLVYPEINDYLNFVSDFAKAPFVPMAEPDRKAFRLYGTAMWNHWLAATLGADTIREAWRLSPRTRPRDFAVEAYDGAISAAGGRSFSRQFAAFAATSAEWNSSAAFPDAGAYPEMRRSGRLHGKRKLRLDHTAYRLYRVRGGGTKRLRVRVQRRTRAAIALVGRVGPASGGTVEVHEHFLGHGGRGRVTLRDARRFNRVTAIVVNADGRVRGNGRNYSRDNRRFTVRLRG